MVPPPFDAITLFCQRVGRALIRVFGELSGPKARRLVAQPFAGGCLLALAAGCAKPAPDYFQGYIEGEYVYVASPLAGRLTDLAVQRGQQVQAGDLLFALEHESESAAVQEATQRLQQAKARLANLQKGKRPSEMESLQGRLAEAEANFKFAQAELDRQSQLLQARVISPQELESFQTRRDAAQALVGSLKADLETARLGARADEVHAAEAEVAALTAALARTKWAVAQKNQSAPTNAWVHDTLYRPGEFVAAGRPVVSLLPPANLKVRFFVPQSELPRLQTGQLISVRFDGAKTNYPATISYLSTQAEFTPPVIYSQESRSKLVFMIEAVFDPKVARQLRPGQPVDVRLRNVIP